MKEPCTHTANNQLEMSGRCPPLDRAFAPLFDTFPTSLHYITLGPLLHLYDLPGFRRQSSLQLLE